MRLSTRKCVAALLGIPEESIQRLVDAGLLHESRITDGISAYSEDELDQLRSEFDGFEDCEDLEQK